MREPALDGALQREIAHAVGDQKHTPLLGSNSRRQRLDGLEEPGNVLARLAGFHLIPQVIVRQKVRGSRNSLTQGRPTESNHRRIRIGKPRCREPLPVERSPRYAVLERVGKSVDEDKKVLTRADDVLLDPVIEVPLAI